jgi:methionyl-tRNA formyltransferase
MYPELGTFNIHASYLPDYRGAAPINWAIINGEDELGLTAFWLDKGIDTGRIIKQRRFNISLDPNLDSYFTFGQAYKTLSENYSPYFCIEVIQMIMDGVKGVIQKVKGDEPKAPKLTRMNTWIDWGECATDVTNFIRGLSPKPGALSLVFGQECKILEGRPETRMISDRIYEPGTERIIGKDLYIMTGDYWLRVDLIWKAGGKGPISGKDFVNGMKGRGKEIKRDNH